MNLSAYGSACRCLLRLRENEGQPALTDETFLARFRGRFPAWEQRPGWSDVAIVCDLARELGLAANLAVSRDYDRVLRAHRAGQALLVQTERTPLAQAAPTGADARPHVMLLEEMDEEGFVVWCPFESGASDLLPRAPRRWWDAWLAVGFILTKAPVA